MKKVLFILMIFSLYKNTKGQSNLTPVRDYGNNTQITKIIKAPDGSFYVLMQRFLSLDTTVFKEVKNQELILEKCDSEMNTIWTKQLDTIKAYDNTYGNMYLDDNQLKCIYHNFRLQGDTVLFFAEQMRLQLDGSTYNKIEIPILKVRNNNNYSFKTTIDYAYNETLNQMFITSVPASIKIFDDNTYVKSNPIFMGNDNIFKQLNDSLYVVFEKNSYGTLDAIIDSIHICKIFPDIKVKQRIGFDHTTSFGINIISEFYFKKINKDEILIVNDATNKFMTYHINQDKFINIPKQYLSFIGVQNGIINTNTFSIEPLFHNSLPEDTSNLFLSEVNNQLGIFTIKNQSVQLVKNINQYRSILEYDLCCLQYDKTDYAMYNLPDNSILYVYKIYDQLLSRYRSNYAIFNKNGVIIKIVKDVSYEDHLGIVTPVPMYYLFKKSDENPYEFYFKDFDNNHLSKINVLSGNVWLYTNIYKEPLMNEYGKDNFYSQNYFDSKYYSEYYGFDFTQGISKSIIYRLEDSYNTIYLTTYIDENANNQKDAGEVSYGQAKYTIAHNNNSYEYQHTSNFGAIYTDTGTYTITPIFDTDLFTATPSSSVVNHNTYDHSDTLIFALQPKAPVYDVSVVMGNDFVTQPGFAGNYHATFTNNGNQRIENLKIKTRVDSRLNIDNTSRPYIASADTLIFNIGLLNIGETKRLFIDFTAAAPPDLNAGDTLTNEVWAAIPYTETNLQDNYYLFRDAVLSSFDPNDKTVNREELEAANATAIAKTPLVYTIRFQNEGSYYAQAVRIYDTLPPNIDFSSFKTLAASHPFEVSIIQDSIVQITFKSINLYPKDWDESKSHGYISYSVLPNADADFSEGIHNKADIVFDYNLPIGTDFASTIVKLVSTNIKNNTIAILKVYPNPASDILYFDKTITKATATIYSSEGRIMLQQNLNNNQIPIQNLPNGLYHLHLQVEEQSFHAAFVKE